MSHDNPSKESEPSFSHRPTPPEAKTYEPLNAVDDTVPYWRAHTKRSKDETLCGLQITSQYQRFESVFDSPDGHDVRTCQDCDREEDR